MKWQVSQTPLKVVESGSNFHRKPNLYQGTKLHWSGTTRELY